MRLAAKVNLVEQLEKRIAGRVVVVGIGNPFRADDAAGSVVAKAITASSDICVVDAEEVPENHLGLVVGHRPDTVIFIDAVDMGSQPGSVAILNGEELESYPATTHRMPLNLLMSFIGAQTRARVFAIGIQPARTDLLPAMSRAVRTAVREVTRILNRVLRTRREVPA